MEYFLSPFCFFEKMFLDFLEKMNERGFIFLKIFPDLPSYLTPLFPDPVKFQLKEMLASPAPLFSCYFRRIY